MAYNNFETLSGNFIKLENQGLKYAKTIKYGTKYNINIEAESAGTERGKRKGALFSNIVTQIGRVECSIGQDQNVYDGMNAEVISKDGHPDPDLMAKLFDKLWDQDKRANTSRINSALRYPQENQVTPIYNLLRMYALATMKKENHKMVIRPDDEYYNDGHVKYSVKDIVKIENQWTWEQFEWPEPVPESFCAITGNSEWGTGEEATDPNSLQFGVDCSKMKGEQVAILRTACGEWTCGGPLRIMHKTFKAVKQITCFKYNSAYEKLQVIDDSKITPYAIFKTIINLVETHRLYAAFDMAYAIFAQVLYSHVPRSAEALVWISRPYKLLLPLAAMSRGAVSILTTGNPFATDPVRWTTFEQWRRYDKNVIIHSIALSEAAHSSMFDYVTRRKWNSRTDKSFKEVDPLNTTVGLMNIQETGIVLEMKLAAMRMGTKTNAPWATMIGLQRFWWLFDDFTIKYVQTELLDQGAISAYNLKVKVETVKDEQGVESKVTRYGLPLGRVVPMCYPLLTMDINMSDYYMNTVNLEQEIILNDYTMKYETNSYTVVQRLASMLRIAGYDCIINRRSDNAQFNNWAANSNGHYLPDFSNNYRPDELYSIDPLTITKRAHSWIDLPSFKQNLKLKMDMQYKTVELYLDSERLMSPYTETVSYIINLEDYTAKAEGAGISYVELVLEPGDKIRELSDFVQARAAIGAVEISSLT
jgi:hypothetical protein